MHGRPAGACRQALVLVWLLVCGGTVGTASPAKGDPATSDPANGETGPCRPAELFATDNTDDELRLFELQADVTIALTGTAVTGSTLLDGVFWSDELQQVTFERARQFHLCIVDEPTLHAAAEALRRQFNQQAVLTFDYLPENARETDAITIAVPDIDIVRFRDAFVADPAAHHRLLGGSVTADEHTLVLVAGKGDLDITRRLVDAAGGDWATVTIAYGNREIVSQRVS